MPNYVLLLFFFLLLPPLVYRILDSSSEEPASLLYTLIGLLMISISIVYISRNFKSVRFEDNHLKIKYIFTFSQVIIEYSQIKGLVYNFNYENRSKYKWKEIELKTISDDVYSFRKSFFLDFLSLEKELTSRFKIINKSTQTALNNSELYDFEREIKYFDISKSKQDIRISIILLILFISFGILLIKDQPLDVNENEIQAAFYFIALGIFFFYRTIHNLNFLKHYKK